MTNQEFSNEFDVLYNNITSNQAPGLNEYEKSVFLTKAQDQLINEYFNAKVDGFGGGFDGSQKRQYDFSSMIRVANLQLNNTQDITEKIDKRSYSYLFPEDCYLVINEILDDGQTQYGVIPINYLEYSRLMCKPYNLPLKRQAWRLITGKAIIYKSYSSTNPVMVWNINSNAPNDFTKISINYEKKTEEECTQIIDSLELGIPVDIPAEIAAFFTKGMFTFNPVTNSPVIIKFEEAETVLQVTVYSSENVTWNYIQDLGIKSANVFSDADNYNKIINCPITKALNALNFFRDLLTDLESNISRLDIDLEKKYTTPMVEIIGKFNKTPNYQIRYIKSLKPIILVDLDDFGESLSIDGYSKVTECELPRECQQEVLERAVTLAKIAWQGATATQVANQQRESRQ